MACVRGQRRFFIMALVMLVFEAGTAVFQPYPLAYLIDFLNNKPTAGPIGFLGIAPSRTTTVAILTVAIVVLAMINSAADSAAEIYLARGGRALGYNLRVWLYSHLQKLSLAFHNQRRTGDVLTRITSDVTTVEEFVMQNLSDITGSFLVLIGTLAFLAYKSWQVTVVALIIVPVVSVVSNWFSQRIKTTAKQQRAREGELASSAQEMLASIRVIQTYSRGGYERERFAARSAQAADAALHTSRLEAGFSWSVSVLEAVSTAFVVWIGLFLIDHRTITVGLLVLFIILIQNMFKPTRRLIKEWAVIGKVLASTERVGEVLRREPAVTDLPGAVTAPRLQGTVEFRHVFFAYRPDPEDAARSSDHRSLKLALSEITFRVDPGRVVALVGPSGAGKSTIAQLIPRLYDPNSGGIFIDGRNIRTVTLESLREQISMVMQDTVLFSGTVADNIAYGRLGATKDEIVEAARKANAHEFILAMPEGYDTELSERGANLSGGQRQRISIARALVRGSPILILDEPTTGLDPESVDVVQQALRTLMHGKTTIIISHDLGLIRTADEILVIRDGQIVERGRHDALLQAGGLYASLHAKQFGQREPAAPPSGADALRGDEDPSPQVFETMLTEALPVPLGNDAFKRMVGGVDPADGGSGGGRDGAPRVPPAPAPPVDVEGSARP